MALLAIIALLASAGVVQSHQTQVAPGDAFTPPSVLMERVTFLSGKIGVFVQVGTGEVWPDMEQCLSNVFAASNDRIGVHIDYVEASAPSQAVMHQLSGYMRGKHGYVNLVLTKSASKGMDMGHFASQLYYAQNKGLHYDFLLKIHTDSMPEIRNLALQALCGTKFQVRSVLHNFNAHGHLNLIAPVGTTMTRRTKVTNLAPVLGDRLFGGHAEVGGSFLYSTKQATKQFLSAMESDIKVSEDQLTSIGGNMYWARFNAVPFGGLAKALPSIWPKLEGVEVELGNFAVSALRGAGGYVGELPMAPKVMAIYFPQYHQFPENDEFHGEGFTEWTHLKPFVDETNELRKPLSSEKGGLDYYDLTQRDVRKRQAELADQYGVYGFMIYHYWFNGQNVKNSSVMWKIPHLMLQDGQPDKPFFFSWANRRWERGYGEHATGEVLIEQDYANETGWKEHFNYLLPYFQHRNYKKINNKPVFAIYFPQEIGEKLAPMMNNWHLLAKQNGFGGIYFLRTVSGAGGPSFMPSLFDASFHFMAVCERCGRPASGEDKDFITTWPQYWGATTGFDNRVRGCSQRYRASPEEFKTGLIESFRNMSHTPNRRINENLYFIAAWNEWNEQGVLEPDHLHSFAYLKALQDAVETIQAADPIKRDREEAAKTSLLETSEAGHPRDEDAVHLLQVRPDLAWGYATGPHRWNETVHDRIRAMERLRQAGMLSSGPSTDAKNVTSDLAGSPYYRRDDGRKGRGRDDRARDDGRGRGRDDGRRVDDDRRGRRGSRDDRHMDDSHRGDDRRGGRGDDRRGDDDRRGRRGDDHRVDDDHRGGRDDRRGDDDRHGGRDDRHGDDGNRTRDDDRRGGRDDRRGDDDRRGGRDDRRGDDDRRGGRDDRRGDDDRRGGRDDRRGDDGNRTRDDDRRGGRDDRRGDDDRRGGSRGNRRGDDDRRGGRGDDDRRGGRGDDDRRGGRGDDDRRGGRGDDDRRGGRGDDDRRGGRGDDDRRGGGDDRRGGRGGDDRRRDDDGRGGGRDDDGRRGGRDDDGRGGGRDDDGRRGGRDDDGRGGGRDDDGNGGGNGGGGNGGGGNGGGGNGDGGNGDGGNGGRDDDGSRPGDWDWEYVPI